MSALKFYDNVLTDEECDRLIELFESSDEKKAGSIGNQYGSTKDTNVKSSIQIDCNFNVDNEINSIVLPKLRTALRMYRNDFPSINHIEDWTITGGYTFQKFETENDGFKGWHTERTSTFPFCYRMLVWSLYLNDAAGTEFMHYDIVPAKKGRCAIWPSSWEYVHRSEQNRGLKYIMSGWCSYVLDPDLLQELYHLYENLSYR